MTNTQGPAISRRRFLECMSLVVAAALVTPKVGWTVVSGSPPWIDVVRRLADAKPMVAIGNSYLRTHSEFSSTESLLSSLKSGTLCVLRNNATEDEIKLALESAIRQDFAADRIAVVDGWWLSRTEAQICGLVALSR